MDTRFILVLTFLTFQVISGSLRSSLEGETGLEVETVAFNNWAGNVQRSEVVMVRPETTSQVQSVVRVARQHETRVRATGSRHALSDLFPDEEAVLVDMSQYRVTEDDRAYLTHPSFYRQYSTVTVNPSVSMRDFLQFLGDNGVTLPNYPSVDASTVAGVLATGGHGFTASEGCLSSHLVNVQVINGEGEFREFDIDYNADQFDIFRSHLGLCGIVISMTFRVEPYPLMNRIGNISYPLSNILFNTTTLTHLINNYHSFLATWNILSSRTDAEIAAMATDGGITSDYDPLEDLMDLVVYKEITEGTSETGRLAETLEFIDRNFTLGDGYTSSAMEQFAFYTDIATYETPDETNYPIQVELAISINPNSYNGLSQALNILLEEVAGHAYTHSTMPVHSVQFALWQHNATCLLCHSNIADSTVNSRRRGNLILMVNFQFLSSDETEFLELLETIYNEWKDSNINTLPHIGKYVPSFMYADYVSMMGPKIDEFRQLRLESSLDTIDLFSNDFLDQIIFYDLDRGSTGNLKAKGTVIKEMNMISHLVLLIAIFVLTI